MKISVIIPIYNGEKYLAKTIESILEQPYKNIELILVNDGSQDKSLSICKMFQQRDDRIILIDQCNGGISVARNVAIDIASGEYISFVDQDDEIADNIYEDLAAGYHSDIDWVIGGKIMQLIDSDGKRKSCIKYRYKDEVLDDYREILKRAYNFSRDGCMLHLWNCLYKTSIIKEYAIRFNESFKYGHEDSLFNVEYVSRCKKIHIISSIVYKYYRRVGTSTSLRENNRYLQDFSVYADVVSKSFELEQSTRTVKDYTYTYLLRLGASLFCQYSRNLVMIERKRDLQCVYQICKDKAYSEKIKFDKRTKKDFFIECIYIMFSGLLKKRMVGFAIILIDRVKR